jgi:hypothetical protein
MFFPNFRSSTISSLTPTPITHTDHHSVLAKNSSWWSLKTLLKRAALSEILEQWTD